MMNKLIVVVFLCVSGLHGQSAPTAAPAVDQWKSLQFLMGTWEANAQGGSSRIGPVTKAGDY